MKSRWASIYTMTFMVGIPLFLPGFPCEAGPKIRFEKLTHDFGMVDPYTKTSHEFKFKNTGDAELNILKVRNSCACVAVVLSGKSIPPGAEGAVKITFNSGSRRGKGTYKNTVETNDPETPRVDLVITATVKGGFKIIPNSMYFNFERGSADTKKRTKTLDILYPVGKKGRIEKVETRSDFIKAKISSSTDSGVRLAVTMGANAPIGRIEEKLTIHTSIKGHPPLVVPVVGQVVGDIVVEPNRIFFGPIKVGRSAVRKIVVRFKRPGIDLKRIEADPKYIQVSCAPHEDRLGYDIAARLRAGDSPGLIKQTIKLFTSSKDQPVVEVPVTAFVQK